MRSTIAIVGCSAALLASPNFGYAQDEERLSAEFDLEIGVEMVRSSDDPDEEYRDMYLSGEASLEYAFSDQLSAFAQVALESVTDAEGNRAFQDLGFYVSELGLSFELEPAQVTVGKFTPRFGIANDAIGGYFGAEFVDEYGFEEALGAAVEFELGEAVITASAFYADDTRLSDSWGTRRGRNTLSNGGVGNTGKLNNFALTYDWERDDTTLHAGLRHLSKGEGGAKDERGIVFGATQVFGESVQLVGELAHFSHCEGAESDAVFGTLGVSYESDFAAYSAAVTRREIDYAGVDTLLSLGLDAEISETANFTAGYALVDEEGIETHRFAAAIVFELGG